MLLAWALGSLIDTVLISISQEQSVIGGQLVVVSPVDVISLKAIVGQGVSSLLQGVIVGKLVVSLEFAASIPHSKGVVGQLGVFSLELRVVLGQLVDRLLFITPSTSSCDKHRTPISLEWSHLLSLEVVQLSPVPSFKLQLYTGRLMPGEYRLNKEPK